MKDFLHEFNDRISEVMSRKEGLVKKLWKSIRILDQLEQELIFIFINFFNIMLQLVKIISKNHFLKFRNESSL